MEMWSFVFVCYVYLNSPVNLVSGLTMHNCTEGWIDIPEDTSTFITCSNISKTQEVRWRVENNIRNETIIEYICGSLAVCNVPVTNEISLQRYGDDGVSLVINSNHRRYGGFTVTCSTTTEHAQCRMHVFHAAELNQCKTEINTWSWKVTTICHVNKFFSSREKARCQGRVESFMPENYTRFESPLYLRNYTDEGNIKTYQKGACSFTRDLPTSAGNYSYIVNIVPGTAQETAGKVLIDRLETNCTTFLQGNPSGSCECFKRDPGSFPTTPHSNTRTTMSYVCNFVGGSTSHSGQLGPQSVRISTTATQPFVTDGTAQIALFCKADDTHPAVKYTWAGVTCINENHENATCIFTPRVPQDDGQQVSCNAYNVVSHHQKTSENFTLQLNYPPPSPPNIRGYMEGSILTAGENITLKCTVNGGKPKVTSVTFYCGDEPDSTDVVGDVFVSSSVVISIQTKHNNTMCKCSAIWTPHSRLYLHTTLIRLYVSERTTPQPPLESTREMHTEQPTQTPKKTSQVTHVTTFPRLKGFGSSPSGQIHSSPSPQEKLGQGVTTGVIAGISVAVVAAVIIIAVIVYITRRQQNRPTTRTTSFKDSSQDNDFEDQINSFYISADALALDRIRPVDGSPQSRVHDPVYQLSPQTSSDFTDRGCTVQIASSSSTFSSANQTQTIQPCFNELEKKRESTLSNTEHFYTGVSDKDLRGSKP